MSGRGVRVKMGEHVLAADNKEIYLNKGLF